MSYLKLYTRKKSEEICIGLFLLVCLMSIEACQKIESFTDIDGPRYSGDYSTTSTGIEYDKLKIVTFNIEFSIKIDEAINELKEKEELKNTDILFLQEMSAVGSEAIARAMDYNYVYYPSSKNLDGVLYGLAILSKWPIVNDEKIVLPHGAPGNDRKRIAMSADIQIGSKTIRVYNVHFSTYIVPKAKRREQFRVVVDHLANLELTQNIDQAIIAGDFNTDKSNDISYLEDIYTDVGFVRANKDVGPTWQALSGLAKYHLDHIFIRELNLLDAGTPSSSDASDHLPIWMELGL